MPKPLHPARRGDRDQAIVKRDELARTLDVQLWRADRPGLDERLDAARFGEWIEELMESGAAHAAETLAAADTNLLVAGFAEHLRVLHLAATQPVELDGDAHSAMNTGDGPSCELGGCLLVARRAESWDAIVEALLALDTDHHECFHRILAGVRRLSNAGFEDDGLHELLSDRDQAMFDLAIDRDTRREEQGFVAPAPARAFLDASRRLPLDEVRPAAAIESVALVAAGGAPHLARIHAYLQRAYDDTGEAFSARTEALARFANTLVSGCSLQGRAFTPEEATAAATAICNLGLENWSAAEVPSLDAVFQIGWTLLYERVCTHTANRLIDILGDLRCDDRDIARGLDDLRQALTRACHAKAPWRARASMDVLAILDTPAWAALLGLVDECPVLHAALAASGDERVRRVDANAFEFISENSQIARIHAFVDRLPDALGG